MKKLKPYDIVLVRHENDDDECSDPSIVCPICIKEREDIVMAEDLRVFYEDDEGEMFPNVWHVDYGDERADFETKDEAINFASNLLEKYGENENA